MKAWLYPYVDYVGASYELGNNRYVDIFYTQQGKVVEVRII